MKNSSTYIFVLLCTIASLFSCDNNNIEEINIKNSNICSIHFKYHEKMYICNYQANDKIVTYTNKEIQNLLEKLACNPNLATLVKEDNSIEYFDNYESLIAHLDQQKTTYRNPSTRVGANGRSTITLYAKTNYKGTSKTFQFTTPSQQKGASFSNLSTIGLLNAISSIKINTDYYNNFSSDSSVTLWDQKNFQGQSITFTTIRNSKNPLKISNLAEYHRGPLVTTTTWDDAAQSASIGF